MVEVIGDRAARGGGLAALLAQLGAVAVETSLGRCRVKRLDGCAAETLHGARRGGLCAATALPVLFGLAVVDGGRRPLQGTRLTQLTVRDRGLLLARIIERNATIFGFPVAPAGLNLARLPDLPAAALDDIALAFVDRYLDVDDMVGAEIVSAMRSSNA
jgi:hypothetical protein